MSSTAVDESASLRSHLQRILDGYVQAREGARFGKDHPLWSEFEAVENALEVTESVQARPGLSVRASPGQGNWARVPWVALFHESETKTIQEGVYCVYLFREDMSGLYLTLNQGVSELKHQHGRPRAREILGERAEAIRERCSELSRHDFQLNNAIDLHTDHSRGLDYEHATVAHKFYEAGQLPANAELVEDLEAVLAAYDEYLEPGEERAPLDSAQLRRYRNAFLTALPDFENFVTSTGKYHEKERAYKVELANLFKEEVLPLLRDDDRLETEADAVVDRLDTVLRTQLESVAEPQNLLSWRYFDFLRKFTGDQGRRFAVLFRNLLTGERSSSDRLERFNAGFSKLLRGVEDFRFYPAISRSFPTLFLMLTNPDSEIFIRTKIFEKAFGDLANMDPYEDRPLNAEQYERTLRYCEAVRDELESWGWQPQDLIDVQGFLWVATSALDELSGEAQPDSNADDPLAQDIKPVRNLARICSDFSTKLLDVGLEFGARHHRFVRNFVVSLATKQLVILTGLSGSGKTQIALQFGRWLGENQYRVVPVRPDWTGPEALFGYPDALQETKDGRRAWHMPEPLAFMLRAYRDPDRPYLMVLDEMNLAHVERYFADVISGMESDEGCLPNVTQESGVWRESVEGPVKLPFPKNLFIAGTVNVDETTYMFSPKVLDRANTLEFRVETQDLRADIRRPGKCARGEPGLVHGFLKIARDESWHREHPVDDQKVFVDHLKVLHGALDEGFSFGHRVLYEAVRFAALQEEAGASGVEEALDTQVMQKVLPRLHGSRRRLEPVLQTVGKFCFDLDPDGADGAGRDGFDPVAVSPEEAELPRSFDKVRRMMQRLRTNQFVSFTE